MPSTTAASAALALGTMMPRELACRCSACCARRPSPSRARPSPAACCRRAPARRRSRTARTARSAIARCRPGCRRRSADRTTPACFGSSAGARLITTRSCGRTKPLLTIARSMRCVLSFTACSGRPTSIVFGQRAGRDVDLDLDRQGVDAQERKGVELGEHGDSVADGRHCFTVQGLSELFRLNVGVSFRGRYEIQ